MAKLDRSGTVVVFLSFGPNCQGLMNQTRANLVKCFTLCMTTLWLLEGGWSVSAVRRVETKHGSHKPSWTMIPARPVGFMIHVAVGSSAHWLRGWVPLTTAASESRHFPGYSDARTKVFQVISGTYYVVGTRCIHCGSTRNILNATLTYKYQSEAWSQPRVTR